MVAVLSKDNQSLLRSLRDRRSKLLTEFLNSPGGWFRTCYTLRMMKGYRLVEQKKGVREMVATSFEILIDKGTTR